MSLKGPLKVPNSEKKKKKKKKKNKTKKKEEKQKRDPQTRPACSAGSGFASENVPGKGIALPSREPNEQKRRYAATCTVLQDCRFCFPGHCTYLKGHCT